MVPRVFISYSHDSPEHADRVLALANRLRADGIDAWIDQYEPSPPEGWPRWMDDQIERADFVLVVASPLYQAKFRSQGTPGKVFEVAWEGAVIQQQQYGRSDGRQRFIPVVFSRDDVDSIPSLLSEFTYYDLGDEQAYEGLYRRLTEQPKSLKPVLGPSPPQDRLQSQAILRTPRAWTVPHDRDAHFAGREEILESLIEVCEQGQDEHFHILTGPGGIGKTAILVELAYRVRSSFQAILWLRADSKELLQASKAKAAVALGLPETEDSLTTWLREHDRWILIYDDIQAPGLVRDLETASGFGGLIFATSRCSLQDSTSARIHPVGPLPLEAVVSLLTSRRNPLDDKEFAKLAHGAVGALGVSTAAALLGGGLGLGLFGLGAALWESYKAKFPRSENLSSSLQSHIDELADDELGVLRVASCLASGVPVSFSLLTEALEPLPEMDLVAILKRLSESGWLMVEVDERHVVGHPLLLLFLRERQWDPASAARAEKALLSAARQANKSEKASTSLIQHLRFIVDQDKIRHDLLIANLAYMLAEQLRLAERIAEAEPYLKRSLEIREGKGRRDQETAQILACLAEAANARGDLQESMAYSHQASLIDPDAVFKKEDLVSEESTGRVDIDNFCDLVPWGAEMLARLHEDQAEVSDLRTVGAGRWLIRVKVPTSLQEAYGTAPQVLLLAVQGEAQGADLRQAQEELERHRFELDLDLLVVTDERPKLAQRLDLMYQAEGQWVPWSREGQQFPSLATAFRRSLPTQDIFTRQDAVRGRQIIGRNDTISDLVRSIRRGRTAGIFGLRKVGKTTVARAVTDRLDPISALLSLPRQKRKQIDSSEPSIRVAWLDAGRFYERTVEAVANRLIKALKDRLEAESLVEESLKPVGGLGALDELLENVLAASGVPLVFVIDEFDLLFEGSGGQPPISGIEQLFQLLRAHAQETGRLVLVLIGRDPSFLEAPEMGGRTNPMLDWLVPRWLGPMKAEDANLLLKKLGRRVGLKIGAKTKRLARLWTGGHPRLHREFGSALLAASRETEENRTRFLTGHVETDDFSDRALELFLEHQGVLTICREIIHLLGEKYPVAVELLGELANSEGEERGRLLARRGGWQRPENRILRDFGLVQGSSDPQIPQFLIWYMQTFEPPLRKQA